MAIMEIKSRLFDMEDKLFFFPYLKRHDRCSIRQRKMDRNESKEFCLHGKLKILGWRSAAIGRRKCSSSLAVEGKHDKFFGVTKIRL